MVRRECGAPARGNGDWKGPGEEEVYEEVLGTGLGQPTWVRDGSRVGGDICVVFGNDRVGSVLLSSRILRLHGGTDERASVILILILISISIRRTMLQANGKGELGHEEDTGIRADESPINVITRAHS